MTAMPKQAAVAMRLHEAELSRRALLRRIRHLPPALLVDLRALDGDQLRRHAVPTLGLVGGDEIGRECVGRQPVGRPRLAVALLFLPLDLVLDPAASHRPMVEDTRHTVEAFLPSVVQPEVAKKVTDVSAFEGTSMQFGRGDFCALVLYCKAMAIYSVNSAASQANVKSTAREAGCCGDEAA